jgi:acetyltransferase-like isoleucine patch superfamily enzyme
MKNGLLRRIKRGFNVWYNTYVASLDKSKYGYIADNVSLIPPLNIRNPKNVFLYGNNKIEDATITTIIGKFIMKKGSAAAEGLSVHTGNHMQVVGKFYRTVSNEDKIKSGKPFDKDIIVEEDVWIGCNVTLLAGAHLGRSSVIAAGAVVNKEIPPYCIAGGVPAKPIKFKWTIEQILDHESKLYPEEERYTREELEKLFSETKIH